MTDIVERLRHFRIYSVPHRRYNAAPVCSEAADEIERLRAALQEFAKPENWRVNGRFDPESSRFDAYEFVERTLSLPSHEGQRGVGLEQLLLSRCAERSRPFRAWDCMLLA